MEVNSGSPGEHQHQAVVQGEAVAQVHPPGLADGGSSQPDVVSNLATMQCKDYSAGLTAGLQSLHSPPSPVRSVLIKYVASR